MPSIPFMPHGPSLAAPRDSQAANPVPFEMQARSSEADRTEESIPTIELRARSTPFQGRKVPKPREVEVHQYLEAERIGLESQARALVAASQHSGVAWARLAQTLISMGKVEEAVHAAKTAAASVAKSTTVEHNNHITNMALLIAARVLAVSDDEAGAERILAGLPHGGPWTILYASIAEKHARYDEALARLGDDESFSAFAFRGYLFLKLNRAEAGLRQLRAARRIGGITPSLMLNFAYAYALAGASSKAVRSAKQAVVLTPTDRNASFNLVSYLRGAGRIDEAIRELRRLQAARGDSDPQIAAAIADVYAGCDKPRVALRELRRAWHHNALDDRSVVLAELASNIALLEWKVGERSRESATDSIRAQIKKVGAHPQLAFMLADISKTSAVGELRRIHETLQMGISEDKLAPLKIQILIQAGELEDAARGAMSQMESHPLAANIAHGAIVLHGQVFGDYENAGLAGKKALTRIPGDRMLINNVAFCLTLGGRVHEAEALFAREKIDGPYLLATRGLIDLGLGKIREGLARYEEAAECAQARIAPSKDAADFIKLLRAQEVLALHQLQLSAHPDVPGDLLAVRAPKDWREYSDYLILNRVAKRLNVQWMSEDSS